MSFIRTSVSLIIVVFVTASLVAVYLWYNFKAGSNLVLVVPKDAQWFYHFKTKQIRNKSKGSTPVYLDSIANKIASFPAFKNVKNPSDVGLVLFSDIVIFENNYGRYLALSMNSESAVRNFFTQSVPKGLTGGIVETNPCGFVKANGRNMYFGFKHKAFVVFTPFDSSDNLKNIEAGFASVFAEKKEEPVTALPAVNAFYKSECDVVFYSKNSNLLPSHGVTLDIARLQVMHAPRVKNFNSITCFDLFCTPGLPLNCGEIAAATKNGTVAVSDQYIHLTLKSIYHYLNQL